MRYKVTVTLNRRYSVFKNISDNYKQLYCVLWWLQDLLMVVYLS